MPPIIAIDLIQISDKTQLPFAPKAKEIIEKIKEKEKERLVTKQAPPKIIPKEKLDAVPLPDNIKKQVEEKKKNKIQRKLRKKLGSLQNLKKSYLILIK